LTSDTICSASSAKKLSYQLVALTASIAGLSISQAFKEWHFWSLLEQITVIWLCRDKTTFNTVHVSDVSFYEYRCDLTSSATASEVTTLLHYITLETIYSNLSKSNFKDHYGNSAK